MATSTTRISRAAAICLTIATLHSQSPLGDAAFVLTRAASSFAHERAAASREIKDWAAGGDGRALEVLQSPDVRVRAAAVEALGESGGAAALAWLERAWRDEPDRGLKRALSVAIYEVACRARVLVAHDDDGAEAGRLRQLAAESFVRRDLKRLADASVETTHYRELGRYYWMGADAKDALAGVLDDELEVEAVRALAAVALGRVTDRLFVDDAEGGDMRALGRRFEKTGGELKGALLFGLACSLAECPELARFIVSFACESAFTEEHIEAAIYLLCGLNDASIQAVREPIRECVRGFLKSGHSERVIFHASNLYYRLLDADLLDGIETVFEVEESFAAYWVLDAVVAALIPSPKDEAKERLKRVLEWGLDHVQPHVRAYARLAWREHVGEPPGEVDEAALLQDVRAAAEGDEVSEYDADFFAHRAALDVLCRYRDPKAVPVFRKLLRHPRESVRMLAAVNAGRAGFADLKDDIAELARGPAEYAAFGAAVGLMLLNDDRCLPVFVDLLESGNSVLMRPSHEHLKARTKHEPSVPSPRTHADYRNLATLWRAHLATPR